MKHLIVVLCLLVACTVGLVALIHSRRDTELQLIKASYFENVKVRVTSDVLNELDSNIAEANIRLEQTKKRVEELTAEIKTAQEAADGKSAELKTCTDELNQITSEIGALEEDKSKSGSEFEKNKASMNEKINNLKAEAVKRSSLCDHIVKSSVEGMKLCGIVPVLVGNAAQK